jgi:hypothetical protein
MNDVTTCRICSGPKAAHHFCCRSCFLRLPRGLRAEFAVLKIKSLAWLRADRALDDALDRDALRDGISE